MSNAVEMVKNSHRNKVYIEMPAVITAENFHLVKIKSNLKPSDLPAKPKIQNDDFKRKVSEKMKEVYAKRPQWNTQNPHIMKKRLQKKSGVVFKVNSAPMVLPKAYNGLNTI